MNLAYANCKRQRSQARFVFRSGESHTASAINAVDKPILVATMRDLWISNSRSTDSTQELHNGVDLSRYRSSRAPPSKRSQALDSCGRTSEVYDLDLTVGTDTPEIHVRKPHTIGFTFVETPKFFPLYALTSLPEFAFNSSSTCSNRWLWR